jgi:hypothetical protein
MCGKYNIIYNIFNMGDAEAYLSYTVQEIRKRSKTDLDDEELDRSLTDDDVQDLNTAATTMCQSVVYEMRGPQPETRRQTASGDVFDIKMSNELCRIMRYWHRLGLRPSRFFARRDILSKDFQKDIYINSLKQAFRAFVEDTGYVPDFPPTKTCPSCSGYVV